MRNLLIGDVTKATYTNQMRYFHNVIITLMLLTASLVGSANERDVKGCEPTSKTLDHWRTIKNQVKTVDANLHAVALLNCLSSSDQELRDQIAYETLTYWLRQDKLSADIIYELKEQLLPSLNLGSGEKEGKLAFTRAFSALVLSELVRDDRRNSRWLGGDVDELLNLSVQMFIAERDYRGLDPQHGWIHTIAHGSDLLWRLSRHPKTMVDQQLEILSALTPQVSRIGIPAYTFNESDRTARVAASVLTNQQVALEAKLTWLEELMSPSPWVGWNEAFSTSEGMARLHNTKHFLRALKEALQSYETLQSTATLESNDNQELTKTQELQNAIDSSLTILP